MTHDKKPAKQGLTPSSEFEKDEPVRISAFYASGYGIFERWHDAGTAIVYSLDIGHPMAIPANAVHKLSAQERAMLRK